MHCSLAQAAQFPAAVIVDYLASGLSHQPVYRTLHGADGVQHRLLAGVAELRCNAHITSVQPSAVGVRLTLADGNTCDFDHLVLATQANQARALLQDHASPAVAAMLAGFDYTAGGGGHPLRRPLDASEPARLVARQAVAGQAGRWQ